MVDDEAAEIAFADLHAFGHDLDDVFVDRVHSRLEGGVEFDAGDAVAEIDQRRALVGVDDLFLVPFELGEEDEGLGTRSRRRSPCFRVVVLASGGRLDVEALVARGKHVGDPRRRFDAVRFHFFDDLLHPEDVPGLEGSEIPVVAPAQGVVDIDDGVGDLSEAVRAVGQGVAHQPPGELPGTVVGEDHVLEALLDVVGLLGLFERWNVWPHLRSVVAGFPVDDQLGLGTVLFLLDAVETAVGFGLSAQRTGFDHLGDELRHLEDFALRVVRAALVDRVDDVGEDVDTHQVGGAEGC